MGDVPGAPPDGLLATAAAVAPGSRRQFAPEGSVLVGGAALQWLRDGLGLIESPAEPNARHERRLDRGRASSLRSRGSARRTGIPTRAASSRGLTRGTTRAHLVRAALEAVALQVADVLDALPPRSPCCGPTAARRANGFLMQLQADLLGCPVEVAADADATALGAAALAGLAVGTWSGLDEVAALIRRGARYEPRMPREEVGRLRGEWRDALRRVLLYGYAYPPTPVSSGPARPTSATLRRSDPKEAMSDGGNRRGRRRSVRWGAAEVVDTRGGRRSGSS